MPSLLDRRPAPQQGDAPERLYQRSVRIGGDTFRDEDRSFDAVLTTEAPATVFDWSTGRLVDEVLVADGVRFLEYLPLLVNHDRWDVLNVVGHWDPPTRTAPDAWGARGYIAEPATPDDPVRLLWQRVKGRHIRGTSIGYWPEKYVDIPAGQEAKVAGRTWKASAERTLRITTQTVVYESSLVSIGADSAALVRSLLHPAGANAPNPRRIVR